MRIAPDYEYTDGPDACELARAMGYEPDPWQVDVLDVWLARDGEDMFASSSCGLSCPRQNGKNAVIEWREFYGSAVIGERILHSAHEVKTATTAFKRVASYFEDEEGYPELAEAVSSIRRANGQEAIYLKNGGCIVFSARSKGAARGMTFDLVVFDEAQALTDDQLEAMMPTMAAAPLGNRQIIMTGTPPGPKETGVVFRNARRSALDGRDPKASWLEWSIESLEGSDVADRELWYATNPAMGIRLSEDFANTECNTMSPDGFARERLGWWSSRSSSVAPAIPPEAWAACETGELLDGVRAYGVKFAPDGSTASLSVALRLPEPTKEGFESYVELIETVDMAEGTGRLVQWLADRWRGCSMVAVDGAAHAAAFAESLRRLGVSRKAVHQMSTQHLIAACTGLLDDVSGHKVAHSGQGPVDRSVAVCEKRRIGTGGGWGFQLSPVAGEDGDPNALESMAIALWASKNSRRNPNRKLRIA